MALEVKLCEVKVSFILFPAIEGVINSLPKGSPVPLGPFVS